MIVVYTSNRSLKKGFLMDAKAIQQHSLEQLIKTNEATKMQKLKEAKQKREKRLVTRYLENKLPHISKEQIAEISEKERSRLIPFAKRKQLARVVKEAAKTFGSSPIATAIWWGFVFVLRITPPTETSWLPLGLFVAGIASAAMTVCFFAKNFDDFLYEIKFYLTGEGSPDV